jgi:hypothetical protein
MFQIRKTQASSFIHVLILTYELVIFRHSTTPLIVTVATNVNPSLNDYLVFHCSV